MDHLIGMSLTDAENLLNKKGISFKVVCNNHNVQGDTKLITNAKVSEDNTVILTYGEFIFNLKD